jgi:hypothetical protein
MTQAHSTIIHQKKDTPRFLGDLIDHLRFMIHLLLRLLRVLVQAADTSEKIIQKVTRQNQK